MAHPANEPAAPAAELTNVPGTATEVPATSISLLIGASGFNSEGKSRMGNH